MTVLYIIFALCEAKHAFSDYDCAYSNNRTHTCGGTLPAYIKLKHTLLNTGDIAASTHKTPNNCSHTHTHAASAHMCVCVCVCGCQQNNMLLQNKLHISCDQPTTPAAPGNNAVTRRRAFPYSDRDKIIIMCSDLQDASIRC